ncbi:4a-hydroxytetrahydrobiopterin dehydratase [Gymnodinialimonas sp. 57CJ19]|uniref:4a-hydroxytetrahydrobiopterin dehydratase n=1 Tax=Gymnodinialimonas sp. 57CJ19 TaxID=3138498 RepID=UPI003134450E
MTDKALTAEAREAGLAEVQSRGWALVDGRDAISKTFTFKNFSEAFAWMTRAAMVAEQMDHHPEWSNVYKTVEVTLTSHDVNGLSPRDIAMASKLDALLG